MSEARSALDAALRGAALEVPESARKALLEGLARRTESAPVVTKARKPVADPDLRDSESVPLKEDIHTYLEREVRPFVVDCWIDEDRTKIGYEIPFTRHFYVYKPPRPLEAIDAEITELEQQILTMLKDVKA